MITLDRLVAFYENLTPPAVERFAEFYTVDAYFKDPFNEVRGVSAIAGIFAHMFDTLQEPRFVVTERLIQERQAFLAWEFRFRLRRWRPGSEQCIRGASLLRFDAQGLVCQHRDYWDAAEELYEKLPLLGILMRWLRNAGSASRKTLHAHRSPP